MVGRKSEIVLVRVVGGCVGRMGTIGMGVVLLPQLLLKKKRKIGNDGCGGVCNSELLLIWICLGGHDDTTSRVLCTS